MNGRTPYGVRGLKQCFFKCIMSVFESHSVWSAWIETLYQRRSSSIQTQPVFRTCTEQYDDRLKS